MLILALALLAAHTATSYKNTGDITVPAGTSLMQVDAGAIDKKSAELKGWTLGMDVDTDPPLVRVNCILITFRNGAQEDAIGDFLYRPGRALRSAPVVFDDPYLLEADEELHLVAHLSNFGTEPVTARCNVMARFRVEAGP